MLLRSPCPGQRRPQGTPAMRISEWRMSSWHLADVGGPPQRENAAGGVRVLFTLTGSGGPCHSPPTTYTPVCTCVKVHRQGCAGYVACEPGTAAALRATPGAEEPEGTSLPLSTQGEWETPSLTAAMTRSRLEPPGPSLTPSRRTPEAPGAGSESAAATCPVCPRSDQRAQTRPHTPRMPAAPRGVLLGMWNFPAHSLYLCPLHWKHGILTTGPLRKSRGF